jgi:hypothetical protein
VFFTSGNRTLFVERKGVSFVEFVGPTASAGESGGPLGSLDDLVNDTNLQEWIRESFDASTVTRAIAEAKRLLAEP